MTSAVAESIQAGKSLLFAARDGDQETVVKMLEQHAPFVNDWLGSTPLHHACKNNHLKIVEILLQSGAPKDARTKVDKTSLHFAAFCGHIEIIKLLLERGAEIDCLDMLGMTPLHWACENQHVDCIRLLLQKRASIHPVSKFGKTAAKIARDLGRMDIFNLIINFVPETATGNDLDVKAAETPTTMTENDVKDLKKELATNLGSKLAHFLLGTNETPLTVNGEVDPKTYSKARKRGGKQTDGNSPKKKKTEEDKLDKILPLFRDCGSLSPTEAERQARTMRLLETHGIKMLPNDDYTIVASAVKSGQTVCLTEAGKMALNSIEMPSSSLPPSLNKVTPPAENEALSLEKPAKKIQSSQLVHVNSLNLANNNLEGRRIIKIRADQLINMKKQNKVLIRPATNMKTLNKLVNMDLKLSDSIDLLKLEETANSFKIEESDFDEVMKQLSASQALVKLYRQQLINKERELLLYKQLLQKTTNELKALQKKQPVDASNPS